MTAAVLTDTQVLNQLSSGIYWSTNTATFVPKPVITFDITTSFPAADANHPEYTGATGLNATQTAAAVLTVNLWDDLIAPSFQQAASGAGDIGFGNSTYLDTVAVNAYAYTSSFYFINGAQNTKAEAHLWFNPNKSVSPQGGPISSGDLNQPVVGNYSFHTFLHEFGHALGLKHMGNYNGTADATTQASGFQDSTLYSIMSYFGPNHDNGANNPVNGYGIVAWANWTVAGKTYSPQTPMMNDIMAIQSIYGVSTTTRTGDTVYGFNCTITGSEAAIYDFNQNAHPILCIFDSSGRDTLDLSGYSTNSRIDLNAGAFSDAGGMTNNISIAKNTVIEVAIGGSGDDNIFGNDAANTLNGNAGNDTLSGGLGSDIVNGGAGNDRLVIDVRQAGDIDTISGGLGNDTLDLSGMTSSVWVDLAYAGPRVWTSGGNVSTGANANIIVANVDTVENVIGTSGSDTIIGDGNDNTYKYTGNTAGTPDTFQGRGGSDTLDVSSLSSVWVDLNRPIYYGNVFTSGTNQGYGYNSNTLVVALAGVENIIGTTGADTIFGDANNNTFVSNGVAHVGNAYPIATDYFNGGAGSDTIDLSSLNYNGAVWVDLTYVGYQVWLAKDISTAYGYNANTPIATLVSVENVVGTAGTDQILGDAADNTYFYNGKAAGSYEYFDGRGGNNSFDGSRSDTSLWVGLGYSAMEVWTVGSTANSTSANANTQVADLVSVENVVGSRFGDTLVGDGFNNRIEGGKGDDILAGGGGNDTFVFRFDTLNQVGDGHDQINDFSAGLGLGDVIELNGYAALGISNFAQLMALATNTGAGVHVQLTATDSIDILGLIKTQLVADDFVFG